MRSPLEQFLKQALVDFETELRKHGSEAPTHRAYRMRGADQFAAFLLGHRGLGAELYIFDTPARNRLELDTDLSGEPVSWVAQDQIDRLIHSHGC